MYRVENPSIRGHLIQIVIFEENVRKPVYMSVLSVKSSFSKKIQKNVHFSGLFSNLNDFLCVKWPDESSLQG